MLPKSSKHSFLSFVFLILLTLFSSQFIIYLLVSASPVATMYVHPQDQTVSASFTVDINVTDVADLYGWEFNLNYSTSIISATSVTEGPFLESDVETLWIIDDDDFVYKTYAEDPSSAVDSWDTGQGRPYGIEYVNGYVYFVDRSSDTLYNKTVTGGDGSPASWYIGSWADPYGLGWNGTHFLIADRGGDAIEFASFSNPVVSAGSITYAGISYVESVTFDGTWIWAGDTGTDMVYKLNATTGAINASWAFTDPNGLYHDGTNLWICKGSNVYEYSEAGSLLATYSAPSTASEGLGMSTSPDRIGNTNFLSTVDDSNGRVNASCTLLGDLPGVTGDGVLATINFDIDSTGTSDLDLHETSLEGYNYSGDQTTYRITHVRYDGSVTVTGLPEFPLGATAEIALAAVIIYLWWRRRKAKLYKSPPHRY